MQSSILRPLHPLSEKDKSNKQFIGFDIETCDDNKTFVCASMSLPDDTFIEFRDKREFIKEMMKQKYSGYIFVASMMEFDALGIFRHTEYESCLNIMQRGTFIISIKTYVEDGKLVRVPKDPHNAWKIVMLDTMNFAAMSVEKLGKLVGLKKMPHPKCFNKMCESDDEWKEMFEYNRNDSLISRKAMEFLYRSFSDMGIKMKMTLASTAMDDFKRNHLDHPLRRMCDDDLEFCFRSFFGAMSCVFKRGFHDNNRHGKKLYYHDINSMYPYIMHDIEMPHPNYMRIKYDDPDCIYRYEGCSEVEMFCPKMNHPLLPVKEDNLVLFPTGTFSGVYTHIELRKAVSLGYKVLKCKKSIYSTVKIKPFEYIKNYYDIRKKYQEEGNTGMAYIYKILMNSLYGKWGERGLNSTKMIHKDSVTEKDLLEATEIDQVGDYFILKEGKINYKPHTNPLWAGYITAQGRIMINDLCRTHDAYYCDTDSVVCDHMIEHSHEFGKLKLEYVINEAVFVRSKYYMCKTDTEVLLKIKGLPKMIYDPDTKQDRLMEERDFVEAVKGVKQQFHKFMRFRESVRRNKIQNERILTEKEFSLNDTKRRWPKQFSFTDCDDSEPWEMKDGIRLQEGEMIAI